MQNVALIIKKCLRALVTISLQLQLLDRTEATEHLKIGYCRTTPVFDLEVLQLLLATAYDTKVPANGIAFLYIIYNTPLLH